MKQTLGHLLFLVLAIAAGTLPSIGPADGYESRVFTATVSDKPISPDGTVILLDLPKELHMKNVGGSDGAGLCVFTSINHAAYWQNVPQLWEFQRWMTKHPGGGYPSKVDAKIKEICRANNQPEPKYIQIENGDLEILKLACRTGRMPSITYSFSPSGRYGGSRIAHMVTLLHCDEKWACVMDNNFPKTYEWMSLDELKRSYTGGSKNGWTVLLMNPGPPPPPKN